VNNILWGSFVVGETCWPLTNYCTQNTPTLQFWHSISSPCIRAPLGGRRGNSPTASDQQNAEERLKAAGNGRLQLKLGINKWQEIQHRDLQRAKELSDVEGDWWQVDLSFEEVPPPPASRTSHFFSTAQNAQILSQSTFKLALDLQTVFMVDFVVMDANSQAVDNNRGQDYHLKLVDALSEEEVLQRQAAMLAQMEEERLQVTPLASVLVRLCRVVGSRVHPTRLVQPHTCTLGYGSGRSDPSLKLASSHRCYRPSWWLRGGSCFSSHVVVGVAGPGFLDDAKLGRAQDVGGPIGSPVPSGIPWNTKTWNHDSPRRVKDSNPRRTPWQFY